MIEPIYQAAHSYIKRSGYRWMIPELSYAGWSADFIAWGPSKGILEIEKKLTWSDYCADKLKSCDYRHSFTLRDGTGKKALALADKYSERTGRHKNNREIGKQGHLAYVNKIVDWSSGFKEKTDKVECSVHTVVTKYGWLLGSYPCSWRPTHFVYLAPLELAERIAADPERPKPFGVWGFVEAHGTAEDHIKLVRPVRRLAKINPMWLVNFKREAFTRACFFMDGYYGYTVPDEMGRWTPTPENINALPLPIRQYIHDIETACSNADIVQENTALRMQVEGLTKTIEERNEVARGG